VKRRNTWLSPKDQRIRQLARRIETPEQLQDIVDSADPRMRGAVRSRIVQFCRQEVRDAVCEFGAEPLSPLEG